MGNPSYLAVKLAGEYKPVRLVSMRGNKTNVSAPGKKDNKPSDSELARRDLKDLSVPRHWFGSGDINPDTASILMDFYRGGTRGIQLLGDDEYSLKALERLRDDASSGRLADRQNRNTKPWDWHMWAGRGGDKGYSPMYSVPSAKMRSSEAVDALIRMLGLNE